MPESSAFRCIGLIGKTAGASLLPAYAELRALLAGYALRLIVEETTAVALDARDCERAGQAELGRCADLVIALGGDGTLLRVARSMAPHGVPVVGINLGRLGFLVDISPAALRPALQPILAGHYRCEERMLLTAEVMRAGASAGHSLALNDVVLHKADIARMIEFEVRLDGRLLHTQRADGLIVSTPTGSTAYALSGGGPVVDPALEVLLLVPICPHTLSFRPLLLTAGTEIELVLPERGAAPAQLTWDGQESLALAPGDRVCVRRAPRKLRLLHPPDYDFYALLRNKLHWGGRGDGADAPTGRV